MSDSEIDNNENPVIESETVESEIAESMVEDIVEDIVEEKAAEPVVVKKGSFVGFLAFVFSLAALGLSGYMYYLDHYLASNKQDDSQTNQLLQSSIATLETKSEQYNQLLATTQKNNQQLGTQLNALQEQVKKIASAQTVVKESVSDEEEAKEVPDQVTSQTVVPVTEPFDDSKILQQISDLQSKISQQSQLVERLQNNMQTSNSENTQSLAKLNTQLQSQISNQTNSLPIVSQTTQSKTIAESLLQEAYVQLDINRNVVKSQDLLNKTIVQLSQLTGMRYGRLSNELETFSQKLSNIEHPNIESLKSQINQLSQATSQLAFTQAELVQPENKEASWFDNLISIKKIDESQQPKLSKSEQVTISNVINNHYQMLQLALMGGNQTLWLSEIEQIQTLLTLHFADNAKDINQQLIQLSTNSLDPELPKLEPFLQQFKAINLANENE